MNLPLSASLDSGEVLHLTAQVTHARRGTLKHAFRYRVDYVLFAPDRTQSRQLFARNRFGLFSVHDRDHGGPRGAGTGAEWAWARLAEAGLSRKADMVLGLLTQPRFLGYWFNPVSFWLLWQDSDLRAVIAEVNNTFGERHSYLCALPGFSPIGPSETIRTEKVFHVSPYQKVAGFYDFRFAIDSESAAILIRQVDGTEGLVATMAGAFQPLTVPRLLGGGLRRPGGAFRIIALIYWHALLLRFKGAIYRPLPAAPDKEISQ